MEDQKTGDPTIDEIREIRHRISARFGHDPAKMLAYYREMQERPEYRDRIVRAPKRDAGGGKPAA
jgi:hypothetical protein